jgi:uncharacterized protein (TIGR00251 family)
MHGRTAPIPPNRTAEMSSLPWRETKDGLTLSVRLTPRGGRDAVDGIETLSDGQAVLKVRVRAAPTEGEANAALIALLARLFKVPRSHVSLIAGATARLKTIAVSGISQELTTRLQGQLNAS